MAKTWHVTLPIVGHAFLSVEAETEEDAINTAMNNCSFTDIDSWEAIHRFQAGNISFCPRPWEAEADEMPEEEA